MLTRVLGSNHSMSLVRLFLLIYNVSMSFSQVFKHRSNQGNESSATKEKREALFTVADVEKL